MSDPRRTCICGDGFGMNLSCPIHGLGSEEPAPEPEEGEAWLPTSENINALPDGIRGYIHNLETRADQALEVRELTIAKDTIRYLTAENERLRAKVKRLRRKVEYWRCCAQNAEAEVERLKGELEHDRAFVNHLAERAETAEAEVKRLKENTIKENYQVRMKTGAIFYFKTWDEVGEYITPVYHEVEKISFTGPDGIRFRLVNEGFPTGYGVTFWNEGAGTYTEL